MGFVYQHSRKDRYANAVPEEGCYLYDTRSSIVSLPKDKIAVISGLKEYIVVDTDDVLMVCPRSEEQNIKKFIDEVKFHTATSTSDSSSRNGAVMQKIRTGGSADPDLIISLRSPSASSYGLRNIWARPRTVFGSTWQNTTPN